MERPWPEASFPEPEVLGDVPGVLRRTHRGHACCLRQARAVRAVSVGWTSPCSSRESLPWARTKVILMLTEGPGDTSHPRAYPRAPGLGDPTGAPLRQGVGETSPLSRAVSEWGWCCPGVAGGPGQGGKRRGWGVAFLSPFLQPLFTGVPGGKAPHPTQLTVWGRPGQGHLRGCPPA